MLGSAAYIYVYICLCIYLSIYLSIYSYIYLSISATAWRRRRAHIFSVNMERRPQRRCREGSSSSSGPATALKRSGSSGLATAEQKHRGSAPIAAYSCGPASHKEGVPPARACFPPVWACFPLARHKGGQSSSRAVAAAAAATAWWPICSHQ